MCNLRAGPHCASSLDSQYQMAHIQGDEKKYHFFPDVENEAPILRVNDAASIASMVCFLIKKSLIILFENLNLCHAFHEL